MSFRDALAFSCRLACNWAPLAKPPCQDLRVTALQLWALFAMPARAQPTRNSTAQKGTASASSRRRAIALARTAQAAKRNVKDEHTAKVKGAVHLHAARARVAARAAPARPPKVPRAAAPPLLGAVKRVRERACSAAKDKRKRVDMDGIATDDDKDSGASLGRGVEEGEEEHEDIDLEEQPEDMDLEAGALERRPFKLLRKIKIKALITDLHVLEPLRKCKYGCGAMVWPAEGKLCCSGGTHILGPAFNPPIDDDYLELLKLPHVSADSRLLNGALAMGSQGVFPSRAMGGMGFHEQRYGHVSLMGKTYCVMFGLGANNAFDSYLLPNELLVDGAANDLGADYAQRLLRARTYFGQHHPLARHLCAIADVAGPKIDLNPYMRIEAQSLRSSAMELAHVSSGVPRADDRTHRVLYFDMRLHAQGQAPVTVDRHNALYDLLMFPMLHEKGVGGFFIAKDDCVRSTTGVKLSLQAYTRAMMFQNERLHYLGRLAQEYALVQHSRHVEDTLAFQRNGKLQSVLQRRRDVNPRPGQQVAGNRVGMSSSVVGSRK